MSTLSASLFAMIPFSTLVCAQGTASGTRHPIALRDASYTYTLQNMYQGQDFFNYWSFFTGLDPTDGNVNYLSMQDAMDQGLAYVNNADNTFIMAVDSWSDVPVGGYRSSCRIQSDSQWTSGLFILDAAAMPVGCGTWPSFWTNGPNWPTTGEIDIVEGVNNQGFNQMTLHSGTSNPCSINTASTGTFTGQVLGSNCYSTQNANAGCAIKDTDASSFGYGFNAVGGGVFALLWDESAGMSIWHFARANIPADIAAQTPTPVNWGTPSGFWDSTTCDITDNFQNHQMILDTTICGGWAGSAYGKSGCPGTCADIVANAGNFADAQWVINYIAVYQ